MQHDYPVVLVGGEMTGQFLWSTPEPSGIALFDSEQVQHTYRFNQQHGIVFGKHCLTNFVYLDGLQNLSAPLIRRCQLEALNALEPDNSQFIGIPKAHRFLFHLAEWSQGLSVPQLDMLNIALNGSVAWGCDMVKVIDYLEYIYMAGYVSGMNGKNLLNPTTQTYVQDTATLGGRDEQVLNLQVLAFRNYLSEVIKGDL